MVERSEKSEAAERIMDYSIREIAEEEYSILKDFLCEAIFAFEAFDFTGVCVSFA